MTIRRTHSRCAAFVSAAELLHSAAMRGCTARLRVVYCGQRGWGLRVGTAFRLDNRGAMLAVVKPSSSSLHGHKTRQQYAPGGLGTLCCLCCWAVCDTYHEACPFVFTACLMLAVGLTGPVKWFDWPSGALLAQRCAGLMLKRWPSPI
jgi:hypothetical protein